MKKLFKLAVFSLLFFGAIGVGVILLVALSDDGGSSTIKEEIESVEDKTFGLNETVTYRDVELTITGASFTEPAEYSTPENGKVLTLDVEFANIGDDKLIVDNTDFNIYTMDGEAMSSYYSYNETAISGSVNGGKKMKGKLYYDVPEGNQFEVIFTPRFTYDGEVDITFILDIE